MTKKEFIIYDPTEEGSYYKILACGCEEHHRPRFWASYARKDDYTSMIRRGGKPCPLGHEDEDIEY